MTSKYHRSVAWAEFDSASKELKSLRQVNQAHWNKADSAILSAEQKGHHKSDINREWSIFVRFPREVKADTLDTVHITRGAKKMASESDLVAMENFQQQIARVRDLLQRAVDEDTASMTRLATLSTRALSSTSFHDDTNAFCRGHEGPNTRLTSSVNPLTALGGSSSSKPNPDSPPHRGLGQTSTSSRSTGGAVGPGSSNNRSTQGSDGKRVGRSSRCAQLYNVTDLESIESPSLDRLLRETNFLDFSEFDVHKKGGR